MNLFPCIKYLEKISVYTYDLRNLEFQQFLADRLGNDFRGHAKGAEWFIESDSKTESEFYESPSCRVSLPSRMYPEGYIYNEAERQSNLKVRRIRKGSFQNAWEIFTA